MRTSRLSVSILGLFLGIIGAFSASAERLDLSEGTMTVGGQIAFHIKANDISHIQAKELSADVSLNGGFFFYDHFEINGVIGTNLVFDSPLEASVFLGAGSKYYFDIESMFFPYLGALARVGWQGKGLASQWSVDLPIMGGVLVGLNSHVALDVGVMTQFSWLLGSGSNPTRFTLSVGYVGIKSFF